MKNSRRAARTKENIQSFVLLTKLIALGSLFIPLVLLANGALDHSPVEQHRQTITRAILEHGRHGSVNYYLEVTSWRRNRSREKLSASYREYLDARVGDSIVVETRNGALGIPRLISFHEFE